MEVGRWYEKQHLYAAAIGRFQTVVKDYQTTNHVPEALHRLTEIYLLLGMKAQAKDTAAVLGYNYPGNRWYSDSYDQLLDDKLVQPAEGDQLPARQPSRGIISRTWNWLF
jgi:outer membrane protein assembly factor BamD